jgi:hypothetical protein
MRARSAVIVLRLSSETKDEEDPEPEINSFILEFMV